MNRYAQIVRDAEIVSAYKNGVGVPEIARSKNLTSRAVYYVLKRELKDAKAVLAHLRSTIQLEDDARERAEETVRELRESRGEGDL